MGKLKIPEPVSGGLIISYQCNSSCLHCLYSCGPYWKEWIDIETAEKYIKLLSQKERFRSLHITGGEPFLKFDLLVKIVEICKKYEIPNFVETNCFWAVEDKITEEKLEILKNSGMDAILISTSPFYLEKIPFENVERCLNIAEKIFGRENVMVYSNQGYQIIKEMGVKGKMSWESFLRKVSSFKLLKFLENYIVPKGKSLYTLSSFFQKIDVERILNQNCIADFLNPYHIHIDLYGNYITSFCAGITLGKAEEVLNEGVDIQNRTILKLLSKNIGEFLKFAESYGYKRKEKYINKCHLCLDIRKFLVNKGYLFPSLSPLQFYHYLEE